MLPFSATQFTSKATWIEQVPPTRIDTGVNSAAVSGTIIDSNKVSRVHNNNGTNMVSYGINLGSGNNHVVQNNFVFDVRNDQTAGTGAFGITFSAYGIRVASGTGHHIYHNSVHLFGVLPGIVGTDLTTAFMITTASATGMDVRNNIFSNQLTGGNPTAASTRHAAVYLPSGGASTMNLTWNNNSYYQGPATTGPLSLLAQVGPTAGNGQYFAADFDPGSVGNPLNLRTYSSTLSAASTNDNASFALAQTPPFVSDTDLHIPFGTITQLYHGGAGAGVLFESTIIRAIRLRPILAHTSSWAPACAPKLGQVQTCPTRRCARLASISRPTANSTPWVDAVPILQAAISLTRLNTTRRPTPGLPSQLLILTTRSTTWLAPCSPTLAHHTSTA